MDKGHDFVKLSVIDPSEIYAEIFVVVDRDVVYAAHF